TSLVDALLYKLGVNDRLGSVSAGSSMADYSDEEKNRNITIFAKPFGAVHKTAGKKVNLVFTDTPGYADFFGQVVAAIRAADSALIVVDAAAGVQVGTRKAWKLCEKAGMARAIVVTGLDKDNIDVASVIAGIQSAFGEKCIPVTLPLPDGKGVIDVLTAGSVPNDMQTQVEEIKSSLVEMAAETNDELIEKFLAGEQLSPDEIAKGLVNSVASGSLVPVFVCAPLKDLGVTELINGIVRLLPSPESHAMFDADNKPIPPGESEPFVGFVWRTVNDPFVGQLTFLRILGGTLKSDSEAFNVNKGEKERIGSLLIVNGKKQESVSEATAGDIVALPKLKTTTVCDTLCVPGGKTKCKPIAFPSPVTFMAVTAKTQADEDKIGTALSRVAEEDPTLRIDRNTETKQIVLGGLGDVHLEVAVGLMKSRSNVDVTLSTPSIPYRETVTSTGEGHYKHKKQSGGRGQYGEVYLRVSPKQSNNEEWFVDAVVGGAIPGNFMPAVQKGLLEGMTSGSVAGYPVQDVKVTVYDGTYHDVDSSEIAFKIAGSRALRDAMSKAKPVLLEPIMTAKVAIPDQYLGDINGDLNHRRGRILGMESEDGTQIITADVPQAELFRYAAELRSMTAGQGSFEITFNRYEVVPANIAQKIVAEHNRKKEEE
ncbi:MAG: elongation factor G, partial [Lentisphaerae bacterium]|nr:elongation factor G [Lentisphaerota bacterium]